MSRNSKIVVGIIAGILVVCCLGVVIAATVLPSMVAEFADEAFVEDPAQAADIAASMVDYQLPAGFSEEGGMNFFGIKTVFITSNRNLGAMIMLMQFPEEMATNEEEMRQQMEEAFRQQRGSQNYELRLIESEETFINDAPATLLYYEGVDDSGTEIRQVIGVFETKDSGSGMLMLISPKNGWEESGLDTFIDSLE